MGPLAPQKQIHHHHYYQSTQNHQKDQENHFQIKNKISEGPYIPKNNNMNPSKQSHRYQESRSTNEQFAKNNTDANVFKQKDKDMVQKNMLDQQAQRLQNIIKQYEENIQKAKQYGRKMNDFTKYYEFKSQSLAIYIKKLQEMRFIEKDFGDDGICRKAVIGRISSGKSSFLNNLLDLNLMVGVGQTTTQPGVVYKQGRIQIFDTPGQNEDFNTQNIQIIHTLAKMNYVFILYPDSLKNAEHLVRTVCAIKPTHTYLVRTNCDRASKDQNKTLQQQIESDHQILKNWNIENVPIFATSAKDKKIFENQKVKKLLENLPQKH